MEENGTKTEHQILLCRAVFICVSATPATMDKKGLTRNLARFGSFTVVVITWMEHYLRYQEPVTTYLPLWTKLVKIPVGFLL